MGSLISKVSRGDFKIDLNEEMINSIIHEELHHYLTKELLKEYKWTSKEMTDNYSDILCAIVENLVCLCLYPSDRTVPHWKGRIIGFCTKLATTNIKPNNKNTPSERLTVLQKGVEKSLDDDYGALAYHFKDVANFYATKENPHQRLKPYKPWNECYEENKDKVINAIKVLTELIAFKNSEQIREFIMSF